MLLEYLVTSRVRRALLGLLWGEGVSGSVSDLARRAGVRYSAVYRELADMRAAGLAGRERVGGRLVYRASLDAPAEEAVLLRALLAPPPPRSEADETRHDQVRAWLADLGAPLVVRRPALGPPPALEVVVAEGLTLSHRDATVARVLPVALWRQRGSWSWDRLVEEVTTRDERQALGFFLELTGRLGPDPRLIALARQLRDRRRARLQHFFTRPLGPLALAQARARTPPVARKWGFLMNMGFDSFASAFHKHGAQVA